MAAALSLNQSTSISTKLSFFSQLPFQPIMYRYKPFFKTSISCTLHGRSRPVYVPGHISDPNYVHILDTTLRDGEQSPGATLTYKKKLNIARQLAKLGVDIIEAGFPAASKDDFEAVKMIAKEVGNTVDEDGYVPVICGVARCIEKDLKTAWEAVQYAKRPRIATFIATSDIHLEYKLRKTKQEVIEMATSMDAVRSNREFLCGILGEVIKAGASTLNITDTVGITMPSEFGKLIADIKANTPGIENVIISTHCHNDLGLSTANTIAGAVAGARQLDVTINDIGERAGNASLEEVVMAIKCRGDHALGGLYTGINTRHIVMTSKMGIVLGKLSGRHALKDRLKELGYELDDEQLGIIYWRFKEVAETKERITDADLIALLVSDEELVWKLLDMQVTCGTLGLSTATVKLIGADGEEHVACAVGTGPVDSAYKAVDLIVKEPVTLLEYSINAVTEGIYATATTRVLIRGDNNPTSTHAVTGDETVQQTFSGAGAGMDIVVSSVKAYIGALNKMLGFRDQLKTKTSKERTLISA
ncbi:hypothetical protein Ddye_010488 [Dipteronia dyeriana]|uniref:2-isopropylmalate synthase n=1 Tax=Dipteronia dyeriana TaxID=168575 RepID=A0AAD9XDD8_9ROSI|nr:hypothetical protein Ddye_010488 [Dipteronia dyeriana]